MTTLGHRVAAIHASLVQDRVAVEVRRTLFRWAGLACECPRPENASGDRRCMTCKARMALMDMAQRGEA